MKNRKKSTSPYVKIRYSHIHHKGAFAVSDIPKGARVIEYVGEKITKAETHRRADAVVEAAQTDDTKGAVYIFELNKRYDIDGNVWWNTAKYINHSCEPNCETDIIGGKIWILSLREIKKGEEITYNYGYDFDDWKDHPCNCATDKCMGYILGEEHWFRLRRTIKRLKEKGELHHITKRHISHKDSPSQKPKKRKKRRAKTNSRRNR